MADVLKEKVAIVTGAGRGIGSGVAKSLAAEGASVVVVDPGVNVDGSGFDRTPTDQVVAEIRQAGGTAVPCYESVVTMQGGESIVKAAIDSFGRLDIVVTCHGNMRDQMIYNMTEAEWDAVIEVHLKGTFTVVKHACIPFRQQRSGRIITFSSVSGLSGSESQSNYAAAKAGVSGFTKVVARDMGRYGVTANCIAPAAMTRMITTMRDKAKEFRAAGDHVSRSDEARIERLNPDDVAPMVGFLASDYAASVNGQFFGVQGGTVSLISQPRPVRSIYNETGRWPMDKLSLLAREVLTKDIWSAFEGPSPGWRLPWSPTRTGAS